MVIPSRTGAGGNKVVIGGGVLTFPVIHQLLRVSLHSVKLPARPGAAALAVAGALAGSGLTTYRDLKAGLKEAMAKDPFDATVITVVAGAFLFYVAERGKNPKVQTFWDALVFISTCLSVGYSDIFARTPAGQAIATAVMTFGPAMSGAIFESPGAPAPEPSAEMMAVQHAIVDKLDAILSELRASRS